MEPLVAERTELITTATATVAPAIGAISAVFGHDSQNNQFCAPAQVRERFEAICARMSGTILGKGGESEVIINPKNQLFALYIPEQPEYDYNHDPLTYGRIVALVRPLPMPAGNSVINYPSHCIEYDSNCSPFDRWPISSIPSFFQT
jgi:hypothetical protein